MARALALTASLALAAPAEVEADKPQALAENVALTCVSEPDSAGFAGLRVVLPEGVAPGDVTLDATPKGWKLKATGDGHTVDGPALKTGVGAEYKIKVRQLPDAKEIVFKTVETYSDGKVSRWIELPGGADEQPAPSSVVAAAPRVGEMPAGYFSWRHSRYAATAVGSVGKICPVPTLSTRP